MKFLRFALVFFAALLVLLAVNNACAQWVNMAPNILANLYQSSTIGGRLCFQDGMLWAGKNDLWCSADTGKTWARCASTIPFQGIVSMDFFDKTNGVLLDNVNHIFITTNAGVTWKMSFAVPTNCYSVFFIGTPAVIGAGTANGLLLSNDGGLTYHSTSVTNFVIDGHGLSGGKAYTMSSSFSTLTKSVFVTSDFGTTWQVTGTVPAFDCWSFDFDKCDSNTIYLINESAVTTNDGLCHIFVTPDRGITWRDTKSGSTDTKRITSYLSGSVTSTNGATFVQTSRDGILRTTDFGQTWISIGGPNMSFDTRFVIAINKNIVFAVDSQGSIWATFNSGGHTLPDGSRKILRLESVDQKTDTIGGSVAVPISLKGMNDTEDVDIVIHYEPPLSYSGTFAPTGVQLDIAKESWAGRSKIHVQAADSSHILAYSHFDVFADSLTKPKVTFDSVTTALQYPDPCTLSLLPPITIPGSAIITPPSGCGFQTISRFMHDGTLPQLSILPNPTSGEISIASTGDLGRCSVAIYDMLGVNLGSTNLVLAQNAPAKLTLPAANGVYNVRVHTAEKTYDLRAVVSH